jgi:DNA-binding transcriptional LysR family regulator
VQPLEGFYYFTEVVDHGGFARAARALGIPKSRLSRHVTALEAELSVRLLNRSTRRFVVTEVGQEV